MDIKWQRQNSWFNRNAELANSSRSRMERENSVRISSIRPEERVASWQASAIERRSAIHKLYYFECFSAVEKAFQDFEHAAKLIRDNLYSENNEESKIETPYHLFSWFRSDFLYRRKVKDLSYVDVFKMELSDESIERRKVRIDLDIIMSFFELLTNLACGRKNDAFDLLDDAEDFLTNEVKLNEEYKVHSEAVRKHLREITAMGLSMKRDERRHQLLMEVEAKIVNSDMLHPIDVRFQIRHLESTVEDYVHHCEVEEQKLEKETQKTRDKIKKETYSTQCIMDADYNIVEHFKRKIDDINEKYREQYEAVESEIVKKRIHMDKMRTQMNYLTEQIERFHEEIDELHAREAVQREREEKKLEEQRLLAEKKAAANLAKEKKGKKKGKK